jgi:beta-phosphoglucomutase-like phosphatase (HAD superfamily)
MSTRSIKAVLFDLDGTLLDTEALSDKANIKVLEGLLPDSVQVELARNGNRLPWEIKKQILGLRYSSWVPLLTSFATEEWGVTSPLSV